MSLSKELVERGFIHQYSATSLEEVLDKEKRTIYHGIDPTADSAHAGNFVIWMLLKHLSQAGHKIVFLIGGATGMIGDPKPDAERQLKPVEEININIQKIKIQAEKFFAGTDIEFVNNYDWFKDLSLLDFLRDVGKHYTVNELVKKDAIATRLQSEKGLSYTEFAYPLIQGYDYLQLFLTKNCTVQVGGSDQWGNMISGVELIRRKEQTEVSVITTPLITDKATGKKFGKSEGNAVWLDKEKTTPYQFYQFWFNSSDENVFEYLKLFTLFSLSEIEEIKKDFESDPASRVAQKQLALKVTELVHGNEATEASQTVSQVLFEGRALETLSDIEKEIFLANAPLLEVKTGDLLIDVLVEAGLATSKREGRTFIESGAVVLGGKKIVGVDEVVSNSNFTDGIAFLRRGKKHLCVLKIG